MFAARYLLQIQKLELTCLCATALPDFNAKRDNISSSTFLASNAHERLSQSIRCGAATDARLSPEQTNQTRRVLLHNHHRHRRASRAAHRDRIVRTSPRELGAPGGEPIKMGRNAVSGEPSVGSKIEDRGHRVGRSLGFRLNVGCSMVMVM